MKHLLRVIGQEYTCTNCKRRWDFDEAPDEQEPCDATVKTPPQTPTSTSL